MSEEHEIEQAVPREEAVAALQAVVDGVASGTLRFDAAETETVDVDVPDVVELEVELELEEDGDGAELEVELEWPVEEPAEPEAASEAHDGETSAESGTDAPEEHGVGTAAATGSEPSEDREMDESEEEPVAPESDGPHAIDAAVLGPAEQRESLARFEVYQDRAEEWRWRLVHHNGNVIADGGEGYTSKQSALKGLHSVMANAPGASVKDQSKQ